MGKVLGLLVVVAASAGWAQGDAEPRKVAETYLNALSGAGDERGKDLLLGGVTMNAQLFGLENWTIKAKDASKKEEGELAHASHLVAQLDDTARKAIASLLGVAQVGDDLQVTEMSRADAEKLLEPTREKALILQKDLPVLSYVLRVGRELYFHPKNPMRVILAKAGSTGRYTIELHRWIILSKEGPAKQPREWPLRVVRFRAGKLDTGWKVLPASDWNAD
jgi:hypothetical protein